MAIRGRVEASRERQRQRCAGSQTSKADVRKPKMDAMSVVCNADVRVAEIRQFCRLRGGRGEGEPDAGGDGADESVSPGLLSRAQTRADRRGPGGV